MLHAVGVLAVAAVGGTAAGLGIAGAPGLGTEAAQRRGRVEGAGADLGVVGLHDDAAMAAPELLEPENDLLEGKGGIIHPCIPSTIVFIRSKMIAHPRVCADGRGS